MISKIFMPLFLILLAFFINFTFGVIIKNDQDQLNTVLQSLDNNLIDLMKNQTETMLKFINASIIQIDKMPKLSDHQSICFAKALLVDQIISDDNFDHDKYQEILNFPTEFDEFFIQALGKKSFILNYNQKPYLKKRMFDEPFGSYKSVNISKLPKKNQKIVLHGF